MAIWDQKPDPALYLHCDLNTVAWDRVGFLFPNAAAALGKNGIGSAYLNYTCTPGN